MAPITQTCEGHFDSNCESFMRTSDAWINKPRDVAQAHEMLADKHLMSLDPGIRTRQAYILGSKHAKAAQPIPSSPVS